jgi:topoisomerase IV subunit A
MEDDIKNVFKENFLSYASYVILDRAIPHSVDGLKPVQRRILWTLFGMDDGKLHKVANVAGQTMALHPHGDAPITDALVSLANRGYLLDRQGNFGNPLTGDPSAAARYIETRLSALAKETLFNPQLMEFSPSYDGRNQEPLTLSAKIPLLLLQGAEGIAVGMSTKILPHNFVELLEAEIALLEGKECTIYPDFPSGGIMDVSDYDLGRGKIKLRAKIDSPDEKTLVIREICFGTNTESLIRSIDEAAKKGKIKIDTINDYTAERIEIEIKLPRGQYADKVRDELYAFTDCEISISTQLITIKDNLPWETTTVEVLQQHANLLKDYLQKELEIERDELLEKVFQKTLEQIFIENRVYKHIETVPSLEQIHEVVAKELKPFHSKLSRIPEKEDRERLLSIPIRRISRFDIDRNIQDILALEKRVEEIEMLLKNMKRFTINYIKNLLKKYGKDYPRKTKIKEIEDLNKRAIAEKMVKIGYDPKTGFLGTKVTGEHTIECSNLEKLLILSESGSYTVMNIPEKSYVNLDDKPACWIGAADKKTEIAVFSKDKKTGAPFAKRFVVKQFILEKIYQFVDPGHKLLYITSDPNERVILSLKGTGRTKAKNIEIPFDEIPLKGASTKGQKMASQEVKAIKQG